MLKGADIIVSPGNWLGDLRGMSTHYDVPSLRDTWHCIARARAAENLVYVVIADCMLGLPNITPMGFAAVAGWPRENAGREKRIGHLVCGFRHGVTQVTQI